MTINISLPLQDMINLIETLAEVAVKLELNNDPQAKTIDWLGQEITYRCLKKNPKIDIKL